MSAGQNVIDKPLMSTVQWISVCAAIAIGTNSFNSILSLIEENKKDIHYQNELHLKDVASQEALHEKDVEILLHKMRASGLREKDNNTAVWDEINKLKETHK